MAGLADPTGATTTPPISAPFDLAGKQQAEIARIEAEIAKAQADASQLDADGTPSADAMQAKKRLDVLTGQYRQILGQMTPTTRSAPQVTMTAKGPYQYDPQSGQWIPAPGLPTDEQQVTVMGPNGFPITVPLKEANSYLAQQRATTATQSAQNAADKIAMSPELTALQAGQNVADMTLRGGLLPALMQNMAPTGANANMAAIANAGPNGPGKIQQIPDLPMPFNPLTIGAQVMQNAYNTSQPMAQGIAQRTGGGNYTPPGGVTGGGITPSQLNAAKLQTWQDASQAQASSDVNAQRPAPPGYRPSGNTVMPPSQGVPGSDQMGNGGGMTYTPPPMPPMDPRMAEYGMASGGYRPPM